MTMNEKRTSYYAGAEPVSLHAALLILKRAMPSIFTGMIAGALCAAILLFTAIPTTRNFMLIAPAETLGPAYGSAATPDKSIALLKILSNATGTESSAAFQQFLATYNGLKTAKALINDPRIIEGLRADKRFTFLPERRINSPYTAENLSAYIQKHVRISEQFRSPMRILEYWHPNPAFGIYFLERIIAVTDSSIRQDRQLSALKRADYLKTQLRSATQNDHRKVLNDLLLEQERLLMLSSIDQPFAATVVEPAQSYYKPQWPSVPLCLISFILAGGIVGYLIFTLKKPMSA